MARPDDVLNVANGAIELAALIRPIQHEGIDRRPCEPPRIDQRRIGEILSDALIEGVSERLIVDVQRAEPRLPAMCPFVDDSVEDMDLGADAEIVEVLNPLRVTDIEERPYPVLIERRRRGAATAGLLIAQARIDDFDGDGGLDAVGNVAAHGAGEIVMRQGEP
ncbi:MAG: hypothetical protein J0I48_19540 [Devosia sp.]|nr:hypothetical protein [Devosia sp.]